MMRPDPMPALQTRQHGFILIVSLVMLIALTLLAIASIKMSTVGLRAVNAMQSRAEAMTAAQRAIDKLISANFTDVSTNTVSGIGATYTIATDAGAGRTYDVTVATPCLRQVSGVRNAQLSLANPEDTKCYDTLTNPYSACADTVWEFTARVSEAFSGTNVTLRQGIAIRMDNTSAIAYSVTNRCNS